MDSQKVLLRKGVDSRYSEIGTVVAQRGKSVTVLLADGTTVDHERGRDELTPVEGSFVHLARIEPDAVIAALKDRPAVVFKQLLRESKDGLTARELKQKLSEVDRALVDRSWNMAKPALEDDPDVRTTKEKPPVYKFDAAEFAEFASLFPAKSGPAVGRAAPQEHPEVVLGATSSPSPEATTPGPPGETELATALASGPEEAENAGSARPTATPSDDRPLLVQRLSSLAEGLVNMATSADAGANPLALGDLVRKMPQRAQADLVEGLTRPELKLLAIAVGPGKNDLLAQVADELVVGDFAIALDNAVAEVGRRPKEAKSLKTSLAELVLRAQAAGDQEPERLIRLARTFADSPPEPKGLDRVLGLVATHLRSERCRSDLRSLDLAALARAARGAPFVRTGGRSALVAALYSRDPQEGRHGRWWQGTTLSELAEAGHGPLAAALEDEVVARDVVVPLVEKYLSSVSSRSAVAAVWTLPSVVARHVTGERLARVLADLTARDPVVAQWRDGLSNSGHIAALDERVASLGGALDEVRKEAQLHAERARKFEADLLRTADQLAAARSSATADRTAHDRQIKLDLMRTVALLAAQTMQSEAARSDTALVRVVNHACLREGLAPLGEPGQQARYDPAVHDALGKALAPGTATTVVRGGYTWADGGRDVVLLKAQVVIAQE